VGATQRRGEGGSISASKAPGSPLPSAIAPAIYARSCDIPAAVTVAAAMIFVIRRRAANQFRKSGMGSMSQPGFAQIR
jgi:hypothetical protein